MHTPCRIFLLWAVILVLAIGQLLFNTRLQTDMQAFMPEQSGQTHSTVLSLIKQASSARLWLIAIEGGDADSLADSAQQLAQQMRTSGDFRQVFSGPSASDADTEALIAQYRYLLDPRIDDQYFSHAALQQQLRLRLDELRSPLSSLTGPWLAQDPTGALMHWLNRHQPQQTSLVVHHDSWLNGERSRALIMAVSHADGIDLDAQQQVLQRLQQAFADSRADTQLRLITSGAPAIGLQIRDTVRSEAQRLSFIATLFMLALMAWVFRRPAKIAMTALPLAAAVIVAAASVSLLFGQLHAITLAFGITVLGVALDYPIHLLSHQRARESLTATMQRIWPTLRLGVLSTLLGYSAMALTDFSGLAQLGVFSIAGLLTAALITRTLLPHMPCLPDQPRAFLATARALQQPRSKSMTLFAIMAIVSAALLLQQQPQIWSNNISELSPMPAALAQQDRELRQSLAGADARYLIASHGDSLEQVLQRQEQLMPLLDAAVAAGELSGYTLAAQWLPSQQSQLSRQALLPDAEQLRPALQQAATDLPFRSERFEPFIEAVAHSRQLAPLTLASLANTPLAGQLDALLMTHDHGHSGLVQLTPPLSPQALQARISAAALPDIELIDAQQHSSAMIAHFRDEALARIGWACLLILAALWWGLRRLPQVAAVVLPVVGAVVIAAAVALLFGPSLTLFNLVALMLVAGIGLDYSLFFNRHHEPQHHETSQALLICGVSTAAVFAILATSAIPVLHSIGLTVFAGVIAAFVLAWIFARPRRD